MFEEIRRALSRLFRQVASRYPEEAIAAEREELREEVARARRTLQEAATERARLESEVGEAAAAAECLTQQVTEAMAGGDRDGAGETALRLEEVERERTEKQALLVRAEKSYREALDRTAAAQEKFRRRSEGLEARRAKAQADSAAAAREEHAEKMEAVDDARRRLDRETAEREAAAAGAARVAADLARAREAEDERRRKERREKGTQALARFTAKRGLAIPGPHAPPPPCEKTIGPAPRKDEPGKG